MCPRPSFTTSGIDASCVPVYAIESAESQSPMRLQPVAFLIVSVGAVVPGQRFLEVARHVSGGT